MVCKGQTTSGRDKKNDLLVIHDTGAHGHSMGFQYNGKMRAPELQYFSDTDEYYLIRTGDTIQDIMSKYDVE